MYFPSVDDAAVFDNVVMSMLGGSKARVVCKNANAVADLEPSDHCRIVGDDLAVFL